MAKESQSVSSHRLPGDMFGLSRLSPHTPSRSSRLILPFTSIFRIDNSADVAVDIVTVGRAPGLSFPP